MPVRLPTLVGHGTETCGFAEATFMLTYTADDGSVAGHHFHVIRRAAVELVFSHDGEVTCQLRGLDTQAVSDRVAQVFRLADQPQPPVPSGRLSERAFRRAVSLAKTHGAWAAEIYLVSAGLCRETAAALAATLVNPLGNGSLVAMAADRFTLGVDRLGLLEGANGLWLIRHLVGDRGRWLDLIPCSGPALRAFIQVMMNRFLPGKLV